MIEDDDSFRYTGPDAGTERLLRDRGFRFRGRHEIIEGSEPSDPLLTEIRMPARTSHNLAIAQMTDLRRPSLEIVSVSDSSNAADISPLVANARILQKSILRNALIESIETALV